MVLVCLPFFPLVFYLFVTNANLLFSGNLVTIIFVLVQGALRAPPTADPPLNMRKALIFNGAFILAGCCSVFFLRGKQVRREKDAQMRDEQQHKTGP